MKYLASLLCLITVSAVAGSNPRIDDLRAGLQKELAQVKKDGKSTNYTRTSRIESLISLLSTDEDLTDEAMSQLIESVSQVLRSAPSDMVASLCRALQKELREAREQKVTALREATQTALRSALIQGLNATKAEDLDQPLVDVKKLERESRAPFRTESVQTVQRLLTALQDGFLAKAKLKLSGKKGNPMDDIRTAGESCSRDIGDLLPRSEFAQKLDVVATRIYEGLPVKALSRSEFDKQVRDWIAAVKTLDDLDELLLKVEEQTNRQLEVSVYNVDSNLTSQLRAYRRVYEDFRAGIGTSLNFSNSIYSSAATDGLIGIKNLLVKFALPRILGAADDLQPAADETIQKYLQRALDKARDTSNWQLMSRVLEVATSVQVTSLANRSDSVALHLFLGGLNQEQAHQYSGAVYSYATMLRSGSSIIPPEKVGAMLDAIKKAHPAEYEAGIQLGIQMSGSVYSPPESSSGAGSTLIIPPASKAERTAPKTPDASKPGEAKKAQPASSDAPAKTPEKKP